MLKHPAFEPELSPLAFDGGELVGAVLSPTDPAILIPLPTEADDHQTLNALEFERAGAAIVLPQADASATRLGTSSSPRPGCSGT